MSEGAAPISQSLPEPTSAPEGISVANQTGVRSAENHRRAVSLPACALSTCSLAAMITRPGEVGMVEGLAVWAVHRGEVETGDVHAE